jgi:hypothetical protein
MITCWLLAASVLHPDLPSIPRTIHREPTYRSKPGYCLVVLGETAGTRMWLVLANDDLYVDRHANGDLTTADDRVVADKEGVFRIGKITGIGTSTSHDAELRRIKKGNDALFLLWITVNGCKQSAGVVFSDKPADAPILHFNGPLTLGLATEFRRPKEIELQAFVGIRGLEHGKSAVLTCLPFEVVPAGIHPVAVVDLPSRTPDGELVRATVALKHRC